jgi:ADP-heptose:LPS heptosyltransferase
VEQGFYPKNKRNTIWASPGAVVDLETTGKVKWFEEIPNFMNEALKRKAKRIYIQRSFALGDTLMAVPVLRELRRLGWDVYMKCNDTCAGAIRRLGIPTMSSNSNSEPDDIGLVADYMLERDHESAELGKLHRVHIYMKALGIEIPKEIDWSCDLSLFPQLNKPEPDESYIVFQGQGGNGRKTLPAPIIEHVLTELKKKNRRVYYIGKPENLNAPRQGHYYPGNCTVPQLFSLIGRASCVICMDSSPLWISHFTDTPVIAILGATAPEQRVVLHPLYPEGVRVIDLARRVECKPCAEKAAACEGRYDCFTKVLKEDLVLAISECVNEFCQV